MSLRFTKMHGLGNDFVVIDATRTPFAASAEALRRLADRRYGVGCDQVLVLAPASVDGADFDYRIYNADGSESGQCGNGARCLGRYVHEHGLADKNTIRVHTRSGPMQIERIDAGQYRVDLGVPRFEPAEIPFTAGAAAARYSLTLRGSAMLEVGVVNVGNPHAVLEVPDVEHAPVAEVGAAVQAHPAFPEGVNVGFMQVQDRAAIRLRVFERGAGETLACGSGACAAVIVGRRWQRLDARVAVRLRGGTAVVEWAGDGQPVYLSGPAETVYQGEIAWPKSERQ